MTKQTKENSIYLLWNEPISKQQYIIGKLLKNNQNHYEFSYGYEIRQAIKKGFKLLIPFDNIEKIYKSDILFPTFSSRLPDRKRKDIKNILSKYNLTQFEEYNLLKKSGGKLPIDNLEFVKKY